MSQPFCSPNRMRFLVLYESAGAKCNSIQCYVETRSAVARPFVMKHPFCPYQLSCNLIGSSVSTQELCRKKKTPSQNKNSILSRITAIEWKLYAIAHVICVAIVFYPANRFEAPSLSLALSFPFGLILKAFLY